MRASGWEARKGSWVMMPRRRIAGGLVAGALALLALGAWAQVVETFPVKSMRAANTGRPADGAFHYDLTKGFDRVNQVYSNWDMNADWLGVAYRPSNAKFG